jgi:hypothetical protein
LEVTDVFDFDLPNDAIALATGQERVLLQRLQDKQGNPQCQHAIRKIMGRWLAVRGLRLQRSIAMRK